ncbi:hypothetical protein GF386_00475 [Candidatus Pacearchaeota archaeon]|nr:hypothetical protein [Candidatus Pacearchaeota archaeon]
MKTMTLEDIARLGRVVSRSLTVGQREGLIPTVLTVGKERRLPLQFLRIGYSESEIQRTTRNIIFEMKREFGVSNLCIHYIGTKHYEKGDGTSAEITAKDYGFQGEVSYGQAWDEFVTASIDARFFFTENPPPKELYQRLRRTLRRGFGRSDLLNKHYY